MLNANDVRQLFFASLVSNSVIALSTLFIAFFVLRLKIKRPDIFSHACVAWPALACLVSSAAVHILHVIMSYAKVRLVLLTMDVVHSAFVVVALACFWALYKELLVSPGIRTMKAVNDALARELCDTVRAPEKCDKEV